MTTAIQPSSSTSTTPCVGATDAASHKQQLTQVVSFQLAKEEYGLNIMGVQEIILLGEITEIPEVPDYIRGLINLRGKVIPIVDLRTRFGLEVSDTTEHTRIIVINTAGTTFGIIVDGVSQVLRINADQVEPPPTGLTGLDRTYLLGLVRMDKKIMILLNAATILSQEAKAKLSQVAKNEE